MPQRTLQPTADGYWPIVVIEARAAVDLELPMPRCRFINSGEGPLPVFNDGQVARLLGLAISHMVISGIVEGRLPAEGARHYIGGLLQHVGDSALDLVDGHLAGDVLHKTGNEGGTE